MPDLVRKFYTSHSIFEASKSYFRIRLATRIGLKEWTDYVAMRWRNHRIGVLSPNPLSTCLDSLAVIALSAHRFILKIQVTDEPELQDGVYEIMSGSRIAAETPVCVGITEMSSLNVRAFSDDQFGRVARGHFDPTSRRVPIGTLMSVRFGFYPPTQSQVEALTKIVNPSL